MQSFIKLSIFLTFILTGCTPEQKDWSNFGAYDAAIDVDNYVFSNGSANQVFYKVKKQYPNRDVLNYYKAIITAPWVACAESNEWKSFGDDSGNEPLFIHQTVQRWVNRDKNRLLLLAIKYRSQGIKSREKPDNNVQNVYLIEYIEPNIEKSLLALGLTCGGG